MSTRHNPARFDPVVKVTPQEAERNKRAMGKSEAAETDPRGGAPFSPDQLTDGPEITPDPAEPDPAESVAPKAKSDGK